MEKEEKVIDTKKNMESFVVDLAKSVQSDSVESIFCITQRKDNAGIETAIIGDLDPFAMFGFTMFVQLRKMLEMVPGDIDLMPKDGERKEVLQ